MTRGEDHPSRNEDEYFVKQDAELLKQMRAKLDAERNEAERKQTLMRCPKDGGELKEQDIGNVKVDVCAQCGGMWLDAGELEAVSHEEHSNVLTRVLSDALSTFRRSPRGRGSDKPVHNPGNPLS